MSQLEFKQLENRINKLEQDFAEKERNQLKYPLDLNSIRAIERATDSYLFKKDNIVYSRLILPMAEVSYFNTTGTLITISAQSDGSSNMVVVNPVTIFSNGRDFDNGGSNNGRLRYTGAVTKKFYIACTISYSPESNNDIMVMGIAKNGSVVAASKVIMSSLLSSENSSTGLRAIVELETNDYVEFYIGNTSGTGDLTVKSLNLFAIGF